VRGSERFLTLDEKNLIIDKAHTVQELDYSTIRKLLKIDDSANFNITYKAPKEKREEKNAGKEIFDWDKVRDHTEEKTNVIKFTGYHNLKKALDIPSSRYSWQDFIIHHRDKLDEIARVFSFYEDDKEINTLLLPLDLTPEQIENLYAMDNFSKTINLSLKVINKIIPFLQKNYSYDEACLEAGYHHSQKSSLGLDLVPIFENIPNPVVKRSLSQCRKVINAILRKFGKPETIIIELARDVGKPFEERKKIEREQKNNETIRDEAKKHCAEILGIDPHQVTSGDVLKYRLWKEQGGFCPYSGEYIDPQTLKDETATQIDHIIPYSLSWNDSYMNKVLCKTDENQNKGNSIPRDYFTRKGYNFNALEEFAKKLPPQKANNLLIDNFDETKSNSWKDRAINDTRYIAKLLKNHIEASLTLGVGNRVQTRNGLLTARLRGSWIGGPKDRDDDRHHALDAIIVACSTQAQVQAFSEWNKYQARLKNKDKTKVFPPAPWEGFRKDVLQSIDQVFVSRKPTRTVTGEAHQATIKSLRHDQNGQKKIVKRVELKKLKLADLENLVDKENRNRKLYEILKNRLNQFNNDPEKAFAETIRMPCNAPTKEGPEIHSVRLYTSDKSGVKIRGGIASNDDMIRVDVFSKEDKKGKNQYYLCPVYVHHMVQTELPNKVIVPLKEEEHWLEIDHTYVFLFSAYPNDLLRIKDKESDNWGYYVAANRCTGVIKFSSHNGSETLSKGVKNLLLLEKYTVDYFGEITPKKSPGIREKRHGMANHTDPKSSIIETLSLSSSDRK
jgi:CRISPR-associated endonuclease Csn1